jgi:hypothetical protein
MVARASRDVSIPAQGRLVASISERTQTRLSRFATFPIIFPVITPKKDMTAWMIREFKLTTGECLGIHVEKNEDDEEEKKTEPIDDDAMKALKKIGYPYRFPILLPTAIPLEGRKQTTDEEKSTFFVFDSFRFQSSCWSYGRTCTAQ